jgi:hypothetical protein
LIFLLLKEIFYSMMRALLVFLSSRSQALLWQMARRLVPVALVGANWRGGWRVYPSDYATRSWIS